jgi:hypothetical protein
VAFSPAVSQIWSFTRFPSSSMVLILKSIPIVVIKLGVKLSSLKRSKQHDLPTPESPMRSSFICTKKQRPRQQKSLHFTPNSPLALSLSSAAALCSLENNSSSAFFFYVCFWRHFSSFLSPPNAQKEYAYQKVVVPRAGHFAR